MNRRSLEALKRSYRGFDRSVSVFLHPLVVVPLTAFIFLNSTGLSPNESLNWVSIWIFTSLLPTTIYVYLHGEKELNIRFRELRGFAYIVGLISLILSTALLVLLSAPSQVIYGSLTGIVCVLLFGAVNTYMKVSVHTGAIMASGIALSAQSPLIGLGLSSLSFVVAWSRVSLDKHTLNEVVAGGLTGLICGLLFLI